MTCILDIDLDYFRFFSDPVERLDALLRWGARPVDRLLVHHHESFDYWIDAIRTRSLPPPKFIVHADEHHDMLSETKPISFGNFLFFAMQRWPKCRVHWLVNGPIDSPKMWLSDEAWKSVARRFTFGPNLRPDWPKPDIVTVCTSPGFLDRALARRLVQHVHAFSREFVSGKLSSD
jgi:hypothetical protein